MVHEGGLRVHGAWVGDAIHTQAGAGHGLHRPAVAAAHLQRGSPGATGKLSVGEILHLAPTAQTCIRVDAAGESNAVTALGTAHLAGDRLVDLCYDGAQGVFEPAAVNGGLPFPWSL